MPTKSQIDNTVPKSVYYSDSYMTGCTRGKRHAVNTSDNCSTGNDDQRDRTERNQGQGRILIHETQQQPQFFVSDLSMNRCYGDDAGSGNVAMVTEDSVMLNNYLQLPNKAYYSGNHGNLVASETMIVVHGKVGQVRKCHAVLKSVGSCAIKYRWIVSYDEFLLNPIVMCEFVCRHIFYL